MTKPLRLGVLLTTTALLFAACGAEGSDTDAPREPEAGVEEETGETSDGADGANEGADVPGAPEEALEEEPGDVEPFASPLMCDEPYDGPETDMDTYEDVYLEANYELELLVTELGQNYDEFQTGNQNESEFVGDLEEISHSYSEITAGPIAMSPPADGAQWHANTVESWVRICEAIANAHEGIVNEDDAQVAQFEEALTEHPNLLNDLHSNTMVGPGELA